MNEGRRFSPGNYNLKEGIDRIQGMLGDVRPSGELAIKAGI